MPPSLRLTGRDYDTLLTLGSYRFLSSRQLAELHYPSEDAATKRLRALVKAGLVHRLPVPIRADPETPSHVWALRRRGATYAARVHGGEAPRALTPREERTGHFLEHTLARNDLRLALERLHELHPRFTLLSWRQERSEVLRSAIVDRPHGPCRIRFVPDGVAIVRVGSECQALAIEIDRATIQPKYMGLRYQAYWRYWRDGGKVRDYGSAPFRVLTVTSDAHHLERLLREAQRAPDGRIGTKLFWFALQAEVDFRRPEHLLDPIWQVASRNPMRNQPLFDRRLLI